jgi:hypothetical protein
MLEIAGVAMVSAIPLIATTPWLARYMVYRPFALWLAMASACLALTGIVLATYGLVGHTGAVAFCAPILQWGLVQVAYRGFVRIKGREPVDMFWDYTSRAPVDRLYAFIVLLGGMCIPAIAVLTMASGP